jgi:transmembrane sensor
MSRFPPLHDDPSSPPDADADAREYETFAQALDPLDIEAATRVARQRNGLDAAGEAELQEWLNADPRHAQAFDDMAGTLGEVAQLPDDDIASLKADLGASEAAHAPALERTPPPARSASTGLRHGLLGLRPLFAQAAMAVIAFAVVGGGWMGWDHWRHQPTFESRYATARGQQLSVSLPDGQAGRGGDAAGSQLQLDTATQVDARLYRDHRTVQLKEGQAMFTVQADAERPFHVWAGGVHITVVGTRFSVRHTHTGLDAGQTVVSVEEGRVRVARTARADAAPGRGEARAEGEVLLVAGQTVTAGADGQLGPVGSLPSAAVALWRDGRLNFYQTPLAQAIAEFERYGRTGLVVRDPAVAAMPVGGSYSLRQWQRFADTLPQVLPVRLVQRGDVMEVVAK